MILFPRLVLARTQREAFRLRGEYGSLEAVADRKPQDTAVVVTNILSVLPFDRHDHVLDIGCGNGEFLHRVTPLVGWSVGVDLSPVGLSLLKGSLTACTPFLCGAISEALPFQDAVFSKVVINSVLYALGSYEEAERTIAEVRRVLTPAGLAYFGEVPTLDERRSARPHSGLFGTAFAKLKRHGLRTVLRLLRERRHQHVQVIAPETFLYWSREAFVAVLEKHGFHVSQVLAHSTLSGPTSRLNYVAISNPS